MIRKMFTWTLVHAPMLISVGVGLYAIGELHEPLHVRITAFAIMLVGAAIGFVTREHLEN